MSNATLREELSADPNNRGYSSMTDSEVASDLNTEYRTREIKTMSGGELFLQTDESEFSQLQDSEKVYWFRLTMIESVDPFGTAYSVAQGLFGGNSTTVGNIESFRVKDISRAAELGLGEVRAYDIEKARAQLGVS